MPISIFASNNNNANNYEKKAKNFLTDDEISIDEGLSEPVLNAPVKYKNKSSKKTSYNIDEIIEEEDLDNESSNLLPPNRTINKTNKFAKKVDDIDNLLNEIESETYINNTSNNSNDDENNQIGKSRKLIEILLSSSNSSISLSEPSSNNGEKIAICNTSDDNNSSIDECVENKKKYQKLIPVDKDRYKEEYNAQSDVINEDIIFDDNYKSNLNKNTNISLMNKTKKGTDWLKELDNNLNMTAFDVTLPNQMKKSPSTLLTVNTSSLFLTDNDLKKRKLKFVKYVVVF
jgi:hypothetical protein